MCYIHNHAVRVVCIIMVQALHYKKYSTASDVWSFGVLMFEIWSLGHKPFEEFTNPVVRITLHVRTAHSLQNN